MSWISLFEQEIHSAQKARSIGNEGKARVCARRAAGVVAREYLTRQGIQVKSNSAYDALVQLQAFEIDDSARSKVISDLLMQVDMDYKLPEDIDLIANAIWLAVKLLRYEHSS